MNKTTLNRQQVESFEKMRRGEWTEAEIQRFFQEKGNASALQEEYQDYLNLVEGVKQYERDRLKAFLLSDSTPQKGIIRRMTSHHFSRVAGIAASVLLLLSFTYNSFFFNEHVYQAHRIEERIGTELGGDTDAQPKEQLLYLEAVREQKRGNVEAAKANFEQIKMEALWTRARYNLALIHIKNKEYEQAKADLQAIVTKDTQSILAQQAAELIEVLDAPKLYFLFHF